MFVQYNIISYRGSIEIPITHVDLRGEYNVYVTRLIQKTRIQNRKILNTKSVNLTLLMPNHPIEK